MDELRDPLPPSSWSAIAVGGGFVVGLAIAATSFAADHDGLGPGLREAIADPTAVVWASLAAGLTAVAGLVGLLGWQSWRAVRSLQGPTDRTTQIIVLTALAAVAVIAVMVVIGVERKSSLVGETLVAIAILGSTPTAATMASGRWLVADQDAPGGHSRIEVLTWLRRLLRRLLVGLGALVALATLALGASLQRSQVTVEDASGLLVLGGFGSALVAFVYVPAAATLRDQVRREAAALFPLGAAVGSASPEPQERPADEVAGDFVLAQLKARREIEHLIVGEQRIYDELVASIIVLGPLLAGALQTFLLS